MPMNDDGSNGYEGIASIYVAGRGTRPLVGDAIGAATVRAWAQAFPPGATVLDLGSGPGEPSTRILREAGLSTYAVDASAAMVAAFRERFSGRADRAQHRRSLYVLRPDLRWCACLGTPVLARASSPGSGHREGG